METPVGEIGLGRIDATTSTTTTLQFYAVYADVHSLV